MKHKVVITGDFNIDLLKTSENSDELKRIAANNNLKVHIHGPTRRKSCLDQILSNIPDARSEILRLGLSDHETAQSITFTVSNIEKPRQYLYRFKRDYSLENITKFQNCLRSLSWSDIYSEGDASVAFDSFYDIVILFYNLCFPIYRTKMTAKPNSIAWSTKGIKKSITTKRRLRFCYYKNLNTISVTHNVKPSTIPTPKSLDDV